MELRSNGRGKFAYIPPAFGADSRYQWVRTIASRGQGYAELCRDTWSGAFVVVKGFWWTDDDLREDAARSVFADRSNTIADAIRIQAQLANLTQSVPAIVDLVVEPSPTRIARGALLTAGDPEWNKEGFIVMQFVGNADMSTASLESLVYEHGPLSQRRVVELADQVAAALEAMHTPRRLTVADGAPSDGDYYWAHSDLKPDNILVSGSPERFTLIDHGVAQPVASDRDAPAVIGATPGYCPPDVNEPLTARFDMYSLAATLLFAITAEAPAREPNLGEVTDTLTAKRVHPTLHRLISNCIQPDPKWRARSAATLRRELAAVRTALATSEVLSA